LIACCAAGIAAEPTEVLPASVDEALARGYERLVVRVSVADRDEVGDIARWNEPWEVDLDAGFVIVDVDEMGYLRLVDQGFEVTLDAKKTVRANREFAPLPDQTEGIPGFPCYRTVEETLAAGAALAAAHPGLAEWIDIGDSWEKSSVGGLSGYDLMVLRLTNQALVADKPDLWVEGAIHARELTTAETATRFAEHLLASYGVDPDVTWLLDYNEIHILLQTNPDGRKHAESGESWRKNTNGDYCGATSPDRGADLNRNFDFYWGCCGGSSSWECDSTFRGAAPGSEPETQAIQAYVTTNFPDWRPDDLTTPAPPETTGIFVDLHSYGGDVLTAFGFQDPPAPNNTQYLTLGRKLAYFNGYDARLGSLYPVDGSTKDWAYGRLGVAAFTIEMGTEFFQECIPFESTIYPDNLEMLIYAAKAARGPWRLAAGPDIVQPLPLPSVVGPDEPITVTAIADDTRYEVGAGEPTQPIAAAELYLDVPPWAPGATAVPMTAVDGTFNSTVEAVSAELSTVGLAAGRHTVFVHAADSAGNRGVVSAAFFWILDPATAAHIDGTVTSAAGGLPLAATVRAGSFATATDPGDGGYDLMLPDGTYDVTASAPGHVSATATGVVATGGSATTVDFVLEPHPRQLVDDVEGGNIGWVPDSPWAITTETAHSPTHSWSDSPGGDYGDGIDVALTSPAINLGDTTAVELRFFHRYAIETDWDYGYVEYSIDDGATWQTVTSYTGTLSAWQEAVLPLPELDGATDARVRFRLESDGSVNYDGWHIDDVTLTGEQLFPGFADGFESGDTAAWSATVP
jgi:hypothetical protein